MSEVKRFAVDTWQKELLEESDGKYVLFSDYEAARAGTHKTALQAKESAEKMQASYDTLSAQYDSLKRNRNNHATNAVELMRQRDEALAQKEALEKELALERSTIRAWAFIDYLYETFPHEPPMRHKQLREILKGMMAPHEAK